MEKINAQEEILKVCQRLRSVREAKSLTLLDVEEKSGGEVTAVALGSYERGDRQISLSKLLQIARVYELPASEILTQKTERVEPIRITVDLRKIRQSARSESVKTTRVLREIANLRGDWNGEIISIRATDLTNLSLFTGLSAPEIQSCIDDFCVPRSK
jgi:transcriptional regulator with XRE-family HTH domain